FSSGCGNVSAWSDGGGFYSGTSNSFGYGPYSPGNPHISADPSITCGGKTYGLQTSSNPGAGGDTTSSAICYNSNVTSPTSCSNGSSPSRDTSGLLQRNPADPNNFANSGSPYIEIRWYYASTKYTVQGTRVYNGGSTFPSNTAGSGTTTVTNSGIPSQSTQCNPFAFPNAGTCTNNTGYAGLVQITNSLLIDYNGTTYSQVGYTGKNGGTASTLCYNHIIPSCAGPSNASLSQLPPPNYQRSPADPTTLPGGPPYYIDVKTFYEPSCSDFTVYALNDTATLKYAIQNGTPWTPYQGPPPGGGYPSRDHVVATIGGSMSGGYSSGCGGYYDPIGGAVSSGFPSSTTTHDCPAGTLNCPDERVLYVPPSDVGNITMNPPTQLAASASHPLLTFVGASGNSSGVSIELGTSGQQVNNAPTGNTRKFPDKNCGTAPTCPISAPNGYRLIYHYIDCNDALLINTTYCPPPPPSLSCSASSIPSTPDPSNPFQLLVNLLNSGGGALNGASTTVTMPPGGSWAGPSGTVPAGSSTNVTIGGVSRPLGTYPVTLAVSGGNTPGGSQTLPCGSVSVYNKPYLHAYGGDVRAGDRFKSGNVCPASPVATIKAFNQGTGNYDGSGSQLGVFATSTVTEFISASISPSAATAHPPKGLTFANTNGLYGGSSGAGICVPDYTTNINGTDDGNRNLATMSGTYHITGATTLNVGAIPNGQRLTVYVNGNITLSGGSSLAYSGSYGSPNDIPAIYIIATGGNIYIDHNITQLDGTFVAQSGKIYTCTNNSTLYDATGLAANCNSSQLKVHGALVAQQVRLLRMFNTVGNANNALAPYANGTAAEIFDFSPEFWLAVPFDNGGSSGASNTYDSISNLPPVL
ncbi:MAG TPA: hypothetical protein VLE74_01065, partial [Candidatus Saccharimonadales bacterium]|nr:hypothetical protein [Candidatus Saccharimonadales bacterium]